MSREILMGESSATFDRLDESTEFRPFSDSSVTCPFNGLKFKRKQ